MPMDGRYIARSQGRRCEYVQDVRYATKSHGWRCGVHLRADRFLLLQNLHFHHPWWSYIARSQGRRCEYVQDVRTGICSCNTCTSTIPGGRMPQRAKEGGVAFILCRKEHGRCELPYRMSPATTPRPSLIKMV